MELYFSGDTYVRQGKGKDLVDTTVELVKEYISGNKSVDFSAKNETLKNAVLDYACEIGNVDKSVYDLSNESDFSQLLDNQSFAQAIFSVVLKAAEKVNSKVELNKIYNFIEVLNLADGDSYNQKIDSISNITYKSTGYSNYSQMVEYRFDDNKVILPQRKEAAIAVDLYQMTAYGFDWAKFVADLVIAERVQMQADALDKFMSTTTPISSVFVLSSFTKSSYIELAEKLQAYNGRPSIAYATKGAWGKVADSGIDAKYLYGTTGDTIVKTGMVTDIYDVPSVVLDQAIKLDGTYSLRVPSNKIVLCPAGLKPVKLVMEGKRRVELDNGKNSIGARTYKVITSWNADVVTSGAVGNVTIS